MDLTRRTFLAGVGSVSVGLLFRRKLDRVLAELEAESEQTPAAADIVCSAQTAFRPERLIIPAAIASSFMIENIMINDVAQLSDEGGIPGDVFSPQALDAYMAMDAAGAGAEIKFRVRYVGNKPEGERFVAALIGSTVDSGAGFGRVVRTVLPISSGVPITA